MKDTKFGTFEDLLGITPDSLIPIAKSLKEIICKIDPDTCEVVRMGDRAATYGVGPKKMSEGYLYIMPQKSWINLGFYKGAILNDPNEMLEGTGKSLRHVKIRSVEEAHDDRLISLIHSAIQERKEALN